MRGAGFSLIFEPANACATGS